MLDVESNEEGIATGARRQAEQYAQASHTGKEYKEVTMISRWWRERGTGLSRWSQYRRRSDPFAIRFSLLTFLAFGVAMSHVTFAGTFERAKLVRT